MGVYEMWQTLYTIFNKMFYISAFIFSVSFILFIISMQIYENNLKKLQGDSNINEKRKIRKWNYNLNILIDLSFGTMLISGWIAFFTAFCVD